MKIYTKTGDKGKSSLWGGKRISKADLRMDAYGTTDELNSILGVISTFEELDRSLLKELHRIQGELMTIGSDLATPLEVNEKLRQVRIGSAEIDTLEVEIDKMSEDLPVLQSFILPSGSKTGANLHHARTVCRRAERLVVELSEKEKVNPDAVRYLNRLSDWLFTAARWQNMHEQVPESEWNA